MVMSNAELQRRVEQNTNDTVEIYDILKAHTLRFDGIDTRLDGIDKRFDGVDERLDGIVVKLDTVIDILTER
ncbi:hypothetical protein [Microbacterium sp. A84]|uniref:hypothetical protein n=1 Tax=Microbacterium sp. A84 TaxID=3450715 RepID=UPI003F41E50B